MLNFSAEAEVTGSTPGVLSAVFTAGEGLVAAGVVSVFIILAINASKLLSTSTEEFLKK